MTILADLAAGPVSSSWGVNLVIVLVLIIVVEALALRLMKWGGIRRCLLDSTLMNLASALVGLLIVSTGFGWLGLLLTFVLSVVIEAGVLLLLKRHPARRTWRESLIANVASYAVLAVLAMILGF